MPIDFSIGFISYAVSTLLYFFILIISFISLQKHEQGKLFLLLVSATLIWSFLLTLSQVGPSIAFEMVFIAELLRYFTWFYVLQQVSGHYKNLPFHFNRRYLLSPLVIILIFSTATLSLLVNDYLISKLAFNNPNIIQIFWMIFFSILGLVLVEHLYRNTSSDDRDKISLLAIIAGAIFGYDFFVFADALLVQSIDYEYWSARGIVNILITPALIMAAVRNQDLAPRLHISRQFVFHSASLISAGLYLMLMSFVGFIIKQKSGEWGGVLQASFLFITIVLLVSIFFSSSIKARLKQFVGRNFRNKYDYRSEWNRFSDTLLSSTHESSIYKRAVIAAAQIIDCPDGSLWLNRNKYYQCMAGWKSDQESLQPISGQSDLVKYILHKQTLFTLSEYQKEHTQTDSWFTQENNCWLIIPLWEKSRLFGFIQLNKSITQTDLDTEDHDLLETIAHHISLSLSLNESISALQQAEQFEQVSQMTTFLVHDLKTLLSQLSLLNENGKVHKDNPVFVDDMLKTLDHVTQKMHRLVTQIKDPSKTINHSPCNVSEIVTTITDNFKKRLINISLINNLSNCAFLDCSKEKFESSINHIIQNAVDSIDKQGKIEITLSSDSNNLLSISILDNGTGMSQNFINNRLFNPFDSTKGVSGMGIGVYQTREYIRSLHGDLHVSSKLGEGTLFTINIPMEATSQ